MKAKSPAPDRPTLLTLDELADIESSLSPTPPQLLLLISMARNCLHALHAYQDRHALSIHAGLDRARARGTKMGRKPSPVSSVAIQALLDQHLSIRDIARELGASRSTIARRVAQLDGHDRILNE